MNGHSNGHANGYTNGAVNTNGHTDTNGYSPSSEHESAPVAICSMAMRLPAGIRDDKALYKFLLNKGDARSVTPASRYNIDGYYDPNGKQRTVITKHGYFLDDVDFAQFDHSMFTAAAAEAELMDPNQRLILEVVREALERAGENWRGKPIGTYVGMFTEDWQEMHHKDSNFFHPYLMMGTLDFALANRIFYEYDLRGPSVMYKTACSSAGVGLHEALEAIRRGHISSAIVAGTNLILAPGLTVSMSLLMALSPEGSSKSFDAAADGYARGEAVTALYIKRLDKAIRDGNPIRAVIRSSAAGTDGRSKGGMANPNPDAHEAIIRKAYASVGLDTAQTAMVEAHGTGTPVGDPIEVEAIARCFGKEGAYLGAVKPNLGHSEGAAAITSVMKAVLSLEHRTILPNIKFNNPNPAISWDAAKLVVPFIIDSAASFGLSVPKDIPPAVQQPKSSPALLLFSAARPEALKELVKSHSEYIETYPERLADVAYTLADRREHLKYRGFFVLREAAALGEPMAVASQGIETAAFVFTGQGAQWVQMGRRLTTDYPSILKTIQSMDQVLQGLKDHAPSWSIEDILFSCDDKTQLSRAELSQPLCTAIQIAVIDLLSSWGITPSAVVGHSSGEIAAAYAAGALSRDSALITAFYRGYVCKNPTSLGGMAAIGLGKVEVLPFLLPGVGVACENSGSSVTLSGDHEALGQVMDAIKAKSDQVFVRKLSVEMAYHSEHMKDVGDWYREMISKHLVPSSPKVPLYSSVYGGKVLSDESDFGPRYWQENLENPVLFHDAVKSLLQDSPRMVHVEVGPHHALRGSLRQIYQETGISLRHIPTLTRGEDDTQAILSTIGQLYTAGVSVSLPCDPGQTQHVLSDLPAYPWHYERPYWAETRVVHNWRFRKHAPHDILGSRTLDSTDIAPTWRNDIRVGDVPWLKDHCVGTDIVFPATGYISMAGEAVCQLEESPQSSYSYTVKDVELRQALVLQTEGSKEIVTTLRPQRLTATLDSDCVPRPGVKVLARVEEKGSGDFASKSVSQPVVYYPESCRTQLWPTITGLRNITAGVTERSAVLNITDDQGDGSESSYPLHPTTLDMMLQSWTVAAFNGIYRAFNTKFLPTFIKELYVGTGSGQDIRVKTTTASYYAAAGRQGVEGESYGVGEDGENVFILKGFRGTPLPSDEDEPELAALQLQWKPDVSFLDAAKLTRPTYNFRNQIALAEKLYVLCALESNASLEGVGSTQPHFENYRKWMMSQIPRFEQPGYPLVNTVELTQMSSEERRKLIPDILEECKAAGVSAMAEAVWRTYDQVVNVFEGRTDFLDLLIHDGTLADIYDWMNNIWDVGELFQLLGHAQPQLRVLEIGAGTGGLTAKILQQLQSEFGERLYFQYTLTDVSSGFFVAAQERFKEYFGMEYKVLDISKDPVAQGFKQGEYDLIIASNVLHATPILHETLRNVRTLLSDHGRLFLQELSPVTSSMVYIMGLFVGWWLGEADGRAEAPYLPAEVWNEKLLAAGFNGCESVAFDNERPFHVNANIISRPAVAAEFDQDITLLSGPTNIHPLAAQVGSLLHEQGCRVHHRQWDDDGTSIPDQDMIFFLDLDRPFLSSPREEDWDRFNKTIETLQQAAALLLTNPAQVNAKDPHAATVLGMARTIRSELAMPLATMELEDWSLPGAAKVIVDVMRKMQLAKMDMAASLDPDLEYAWVNGEVHISRFHWYTVPNALRQTAPTPPDTKALLIQKRGLLQSLHWSGQPLRTLAKDEVQVQVKAVGLNFTDVLIAMGLVHGVDALGTGSTLLIWKAPGFSTGLATQVQRPGRFTLRIPNKLSFEDAATMPSVYVTVLLGLVDKAQLEKGQTILIHAAAGGIGIAAIHVARWIGAEIYCTVGSTEKTEFLMREFSIPRDRIFRV
ncbi:acyl transferase domain-containing protein [Aspergillus venezuelensis]